MKKVLIMEDELNIRSFVVINLKRAGYDVIEAGNGQEALDAIAANPDVGVAILDIMVPGDFDGFEVCRRIRATNKQMGIIMLTARTQEMDKVTGLMTGAHEHLCRPSGYSGSGQLGENPGRKPAGGHLLRLPDQLRCVRPECRAGSGSKRN